MGAKVLIFVFKAFGILTKPFAPMGRSYEPILLVYHLL